MKNNMNLTNCIIVLILLTVFTIATVPPIEVIFIIQSQGSKYENEISLQLKNITIKQSLELHPKYRVKVHLTHEILNYPGAWTIHNLIPNLMSPDGNSHAKPDTTKQINMEIINDQTRWIVFCEGRTRINLKLLMENLNKENHKQPLFLGYPLFDSEPTIVHHFAFFENPKWFPYPMLRAGVIFSTPLLKRVVKSIITIEICTGTRLSLGCFVKVKEYIVYQKSKLNSYQHENSIANIYSNQNFEKSLQRSEFSIDAAHEMARFIYDNIQIPAQKDMETQINHHSNESTLSCTTTLKQHDTIEADDVVTTNSSDVSPISVCRKTTSNKIKNKQKEKMYDKTSNKNDTISKTTFSKKALKKMQKIILKKASYICPLAKCETESMNSSCYSKECAMYAEHTTNAPTSSGKCPPIKREEIYFAVKTCSKYHNERLPMIKKTWVPYAKHLRYFSDLQDDSVPTINTGIPNVEMGHCSKTLRIIKLALRDIENYNNKIQDKIKDKKRQINLKIKWLFLADDDTLLSVSGICQVLGCYNSMNKIYLGERYGYRLFAQDGFNYITGGGGIAFSLPVVKLILQNCSCPSPSAPDDMILGYCLQSLQVEALHSARFHQARPSDYPLELLKLEPPISFHKFWTLDPIDVYEQWFASQDRLLLMDEKH